MLARARARVEDERVRFVEGDAAAPPVAPASFDLVLVVLVLEHLPELAAIAGALRPGGRLRLIEIHPSLVAAGTVAHFADGDVEIRFASTAHPIAALRGGLAGAGLEVASLTEHAAAGELLAAVPRLGKHAGAPVVVDVTAVRQQPSKT